MFLQLTEVPSAITIRSSDWKLKRFMLSKEKGTNGGLIKQWWRDQGISSRTSCKIGNVLAQYILYQLCGKSWIDFPHNWYKMIEIKKMLK